MADSWSLLRQLLRCYVAHGPSSWGFDNREGTYVTLRFGITLLLTWGAACGYYGLAIAFASFVVFDILVFNMAVVFVTGGFRHNVLRSLVLTMISYVSLAIALAPVWIRLRFQDGRSMWERIVSGIYQSVRTLSTAGPEGELAVWEKLFASLEMLIGIYFLAIIVALYVSPLNEGSTK